MSDELEQRAIEALRRSVDDGTRLDSPPPELWSRIERAVEKPVEGTPSVVALDDARRARRGRWLGVLAVAAAVIVAVGFVVVQRDASPEVIAETDLVALSDVGSGAARVIERDGELALEVDVEGVDPDEGFLEVWLLDAEVTQLLSLGPVRSDGTYALPARLDLSELSVVDVSVEPFDGDPTHSGVSVLRGDLEI